MGGKRPARHFAAEWKEERYIFGSFAKLSGLVLLIPIDIYVIYIIEKDFARTASFVWT